jgi:chromosomal replication initiator protein
LTQHSFPEIGRRFGGRDHTTVLHSVSKIEHLRSRIPLIAEVITRITETMKDDEHGQQHLE